MRCCFLGRVPGRCPVGPGICRGALTPRISGLIQELFQGRERGRAFGYYGKTGGISTDCLVTMRETPVAGPGKWLHNLAAEALLRRRNTEALDRLAAAAEARHAPTE